MRVLMIRPNYHCGGAEIAGNWPPGWVAYIGGALKHVGITNVRFVDAMTNDIADDKLAELIRTNQPDVVLATAITPMIYQAQKTLEIAVELLQAIEDGSHLARRREIRDLDALTPDWSLLEWDKYIYIPLNCRVAVPNFARGCPFTCRFCSQWKFWRKYRTRDPNKFVDEIEALVREHQVGFFILADEEPTINRKKFIALCEELIARNLPVKWGINTRVTDILRDRDLLPMFRRAGLVHVSLGTEAAAQLKLDRFRKKTIEETYRLAQDWKPDMANWNMYTPWPFAELFEELGDKVEVRDFAKYNFVTPIIQPEEITRDDVLKGVMKTYARFYLLTSFFSYPWTRDSFKRKYLLGCLKAFARTTWTKKFYDLDAEQIAALKRERPDLAADVDYRGKGRFHSRQRARPPERVMACGGGDQQMTEAQIDAADLAMAARANPKMKEEAPALAEH